MWLGLSNKSQTPMASPPTAKQILRLSQWWLSRSSLQWCSETTVTVHWFFSLERAWLFSMTCTWSTFQLCVTSRDWDTCFSWWVSSPVTTVFFTTNGSQFLTTGSDLATKFIPYRTWTMVPGTSCPLMAIPVLLALPTHLSHFTAIKVSTTVTNAYIRLDWTQPGSSIKTTF